MHSGRLAPAKMLVALHSSEFSAAHMEDKRLTQPVLCWDQLVPAAKSHNCAHISLIFHCYPEIDFSRSICTTKIGKCSQQSLVCCLVSENPWLRICQHTTGPALLKVLELPSSCCLHHRTRHQNKTLPLSKSRTPPLPAFQHVAVSIHFSTLTEASQNSPIAPRQNPGQNNL